MLPVQDHLSLISSQYLARAIQPNNTSHSAVTSSSGIRNMKQTLQPRFLHRVAPYLSSSIPPLIMGPPSSPFILELFPIPNFFHLITVSFRLLPHKKQRKKQTSLGPILSQLNSSFCSSLHSYREKIGLIPSPLCPSCGREPHTTVHVFSCSSHPTPLTKIDL